MQNSEEIFRIALGLQTPWQIKSINFDLSTKILEIELYFKRGHKFKMFPKLGEGYRLVEMFKDFWDIQDKEKANAYLSFWCDFVVESKIFPFIKIVNTIKADWNGIINYIESRINNGILEGINSKIQLAKKRARGYRDIKNFINMVYFIAGKLKFNYPLCLT